MKPSADRKPISRKGPVKVNWNGSTEITDFAEYFKDVDLDSLAASMKEIKGKVGAR